MSGLIQMLIGKRQTPDEQVNIHKNYIFIFVNNILVTFHSIQFFYRYKTPTLNLITNIKKGTRMEIQNPHRTTHPRPRYPPNPNRRTNNQKTSPTTRQKRRH